MDIRTGENTRESWWVTNNTNSTITIGDLLNLPAIKPGKRVDLLHYYTREKISHSLVLTQLVKSRKLSLNKDKLEPNEFVGEVPISSIDDAITPSEENEITDELSDFLGKSVVTEVGDPGRDNNIVTEQGIREALIDEVVEGEQITESTEGVVLYGKNFKNEAQPVGITGVEHDEIKINDIEIDYLLEEIFKELKKINLQMSIITNTYLRDQDIEMD